MSVGIQVNFNLTVSVQGVPANVPIGIAIGFGEPKLTVHQKPVIFDNERSSRESWEQRNPVPIHLDQRTCGTCGGTFRDQSAHWSQYPMCPMCEDDLVRHDYQNEISQPRFVTSPPETVGKSHNEINNVVNWKEEGF